VEPGDDDPWTTESDESWYPDAQSAPEIEVDWSPPEPAGYLWFPDDTYIEVEQDKAPFGFGRWAYERGVRMSLLDEAVEYNGGPGASCTVGAFLDTLDPKERPKWEEMLAAPVKVLQHRAAARYIKAEKGVDLSFSAVSRHRGGDCRCR
jgi:hypothetical protein